MSVFSLETAQMSDAPDITNLFKESYYALMKDHYEPAILSAALPKMTIANPQLLASGKFFIAKDYDQKIIACGGWSIENPGNKEYQDKVGHIRHFATHPRWVGHGLGRSIISKCFDQSKSYGIKNLECFSSINAMSFYAAMGFVKVDSTTISLGPDLQFPVIFMRKNL